MIRTGVDFLLLIDAALAAILAVAALLVRRASTGGVSWLWYALARATDGPVSPLWGLNFFIRFFDESVSNLGSSIIFECVFALFGCAMINAFVESGRRGSKCDNRLVQASFPFMAQFLGVSVFYPLYMIYVSSCKRDDDAEAGPKTPENPTRHDVAPWRVAGVALSVVTMLVFALIVLPQTAESYPGGPLVPGLTLIFLLVPVVAPIITVYGTPLPSEQPVYSKATRRWTHLAIIALYMFAGAMGMWSHMRGVEKLHQAVLEKKQEDLTKGLLTDVLANAPSRFLFVDFVHLAIACGLAMVTQVRGGGVPFLAMFATSLVGPAATFATLAAVNELDIMKRSEVM